MELTKKEKKAIKALQELAKTWPKSLYVFSASGNLYVMKKKDKERVMNRDGVYNSSYIVTEIDIENDGGDW